MLEKESALVGLLPPASLGGVADSIKGFLAGDHLHKDKLSCWQAIFLQSKANGCFYHEDDLPLTNWTWPKNTWFQGRLSRLKRV